MERMVENLIEWEDGQATASVTYTSKYRNRLLKLAEKYPQEVSIVSINPDGSCFGRVPLAWVTVRKPKQMHLTDEKRNALAERFGMCRKNQVCRD